jgi:hypothetical protein
LSAIVVYSERGFLKDFTVKLFHASPLILMILHCFPRDIPRTLLLVLKKPRRVSVDIIHYFIPWYKPVDF